VAFPTVQMALGGSFLAAVAATGIVRYEWRMVEKSSKIVGYVTPDFTLAAIALNQTSDALFIGGSLPDGGRAVQLVDTLGDIPYFQAESTLQPPLTKAAAIAVAVTVDTTPGAESGIFGTSAFGIAYGSDGRVYGYYDGSAVVDAAMSTGTLHTVALTRSAASPNDSVLLYIDGVQVDSATPAVNTSLAFGQPYMGRNWAGTVGLESTFQHVAIYYNGVPTAGQFLDQFEALSWTDVTSDVLGSFPLVYERGIRDDRPSNRVASTGALTFAMNNLGSNSGGVTGYYSPGHASCRAGFAKGTPVRVLTGSDVQFIGRLRTIAPAPGRQGNGVVKVMATDFIDQCALFLMETTPILEDVRGDQVFEAIVALMPNQPHGFSVDPGSETYPLVLDNTRDEAVSALAEFHRLAVSELGLIYVRRTGELVYEARSTRIGTPTASVTLADTMHGLEVAEVSADVLNRVQITVHPRVVDSAATTVLFATANPIAIAAGETKVIMGPYRTPSMPGVTTRVGGVDMVTPVATTDYLMNSLSDGTGTNLTTSLTVTANYGANGVRLVLASTAAEPAYITFLQCRGKGIYDFRTEVLRAQNDGAVASDGVNALTLDMVYQQDPNVGKSLADYLLAGYGDLDGTRVKRVMMLPDAAGMPANLLTKDISDRAAVSETITGATGEYYINGVKHEFQNRTLPAVTWWLSPASAQAYWILDLVGASELDSNAILAP
jgi:hypothetical protein